MPRPIGGTAGIRPWSHDMADYDAKTIEPRWQKYWTEIELGKADGSRQGKGNRAKYDCRLRRVYRSAGRYQHGWRLLGWGENHRGCRGEVARGS